LEFCEAIHPLLLKLHSSVKIGFMDDLTLSGDLHTVERDIATIMESSSETGLQLNVDKCKIITDNFTEVNTLATFSDFIRVNKEDMTTWGLPSLKAKHRTRPFRTR